MQGMIDAIQAVVNNTTTTTTDSCNERIIDLLIEWLSKMMKEGMKY